MKNLSLAINNLLISSLLLCVVTLTSSAQSTPSLAKTQQLLSKLNLEAPGLQNVKQSLNNPEKAAEELLKYYKKRSFVKHPIQKQLATEEITERNLKWANEALQHIFVGQPAYDSHFCGEDIDWSSNPTTDNEWVWQLNRMYFWSAMGKVYSKTGDEKYAEEWGKQLIDWVADNPRDTEHHYAWRSIETGIRGYNWTALFHRFIQSPNFTPEVLVALLNSLYDHAEFLMTVYRTKSNWGLMEAEGMAFIAFTFPEFENGETWKMEAIRRLNNEISIQVYPDGHQRELAMGYHIGCIRWFYRTYQLAKLNGLETAFPESYLEMIEKMCEVPLKLCLPDGTNVQFGDAWRGEPGQYADLFLEWSELFGRKEFLYMATGGEQGVAPTQTAFALPESGLYSMRSSWDKTATCLVLKCGPDGGGHCQPENGTFALYSGGRNLMPDAGSFIYSGNPEGRKWFRRTKHHQTLTLNGEDSKYAPKLIKWKPGEEQDVLIVENQSYADLKHRRSVYFIDKEYFVIIDEAMGTGSGDVDIHFQLAPGGDNPVFDTELMAVHSNFTEGTNVFVQTLKQKELQLSEEEGWVSFEYTKKEPRPAFRYRLKKDKGNETLRFVTVVSPYKNDKPKVKIKVKNETKKNAAVLEITMNGKQKTIKHKL